MDYKAVSHWHDDLEFIVILEGKMSYEINGERIEISQGEGLFINSRQLHNGFSDEKQECKFICIVLHPSILCANEWFENKYIKSLLYKNELEYIILKEEVSWQKRILDLLIDMYQSVDDELIYFKVQQSFFEICEIIFRNKDICVNSHNFNSLKLNTLKDMIGFIQKNYNKKITLIDIASSGNCCKSKCSAIFKELLKQSPNQYLIDYRLDRSRNLLLSTDKTILEIAIEVGFNSSSYYCEAFRKKYSTSPTQYRKKLIETQNINLQ
nr:AraC family transcriptional regulator [Clostridium sp. 1001270J_160509_D11]